MINPIHNPPLRIDDAVRRPEVVGPSLASCEACDRPACAVVRHWSGATLDLCRECLARARRGER